MKTKFKIPVKGSDNSALLHIGIEPGPFAKDDTHRVAGVSNNWYINEFKNKVKVFDANNSLRASLVENEDIRLELTLYNRFVIDTKEISNNVFESLVIDNKSGQSKVVYNKKSNNKNNSIQSCNKWLNDNYPDWEDSSKYW